MKEQQELNPIVKFVAEQYEFIVKWDEDLNKWIIKDKEVSEYFFWDSTETVEQFFKELKEAFYRMGGEDSSGYWWLS